MTISLHSCFRPPPPSTPTPLAKTSSTSPIALWSEKKEVSSRSRWMSTVAFVIVVSSAVFGGAHGDGDVLAGELRAVEELEVIGKVMRWSDVRSCPPWHANSLENVVPENLPRPSGGRKSNRAAAYGHHVTALAVGSSIHYSSSCYSL